MEKGGGQINYNATMKERNRNKRILSRIQAKYKSREKEKKKHLRYVMRNYLRKRIYRNTQKTLSCSNEMHSNKMKEKRHLSIEGIKRILKN